VSLHSGGERQQAPPVATSSAATTTGRSPCSTAWPPPWQLATTRLPPPTFSSPLLFSPYFRPRLHAEFILHTGRRDEGGIINPPSWAGSVLAQPEYMDWYRPRP
jgi:hypothetical protein